MSEGRYETETKIGKIEKVLPKRLSYSDPFLLSHFATSLSRVESIVG